MNRWIFKAFTISALLIGISGPAHAQATDCWVTWFERTAETADGDIIPVAGFRHDTARVQTITVTEQSSAAPSWATMARVYCAIQVFLEHGPNPTATLGSMPLAAATVEYFGIRPNSATIFAFCDADCS